MYYRDGNWTKKLTCFIGMFCCFFVASCKTQAEKEFENEAWQHKMDSIGNATLDSIYKKQVQECDSLQNARIPILVDSLVKNALLKRLLDKMK